MKGFCITIDGVDGSIAPLSEGSLFFDEIEEIKGLKDDEIEEGKLTEHKMLLERLKRAKIKIFKIKLVKEIPYEDFTKELNND